MIELNLLNNNQALITTNDVSELDLVRSNFSVVNPAHGRTSGFTPSRLYAITPSGKYDIGLTDNIVNFLKNNNVLYKINNDLLEKVNVGFENPIIKQYDLTYREHQEKAIDKSLKKGRGVVVIPTAGGKTLVMCSIIESLRLNLNKPDALAMVIVPSLQLVTQTAKDFEDYGMQKITKWSGSNKIDSSATTIIAGTQILLSDKSNLSILNDVDILLVDETHGLRKGNKINSIFSLIKTKHRFGFTGTMPPSPIDQWNIIGKMGPIVYEEKTKQLKTKNLISNFKIFILNIKHRKIPNIFKNIKLPAEAYNNEIDFLINNPRRNDIISNLAFKLDKNTIIMVDRIDHGLNLEKNLKKICKNSKPVYFVRGSMEIEEREKIRKLMENRNDVIVIAISKIFSTGINIPNLHNIIFSSAGKAKIKIMQSIGRALRLHPTKTLARIFDISDNMKYSKNHLDERIKLYESEKYTYEKKEI
jgi:superfamily II DNA or RNA helicase